MPARKKPLRLDWYVLTELVGPFAGGIVFFIFISLMFQALRLTEFFIIHGVAGGILGAMAALMALAVLPMALPISFLVAVLIGFGRLSADSELVAMKASGISLWRLTRPVLVFALIVAGLTLGLTLEWCPWGERTFKSTLIRVSNTKVVSSIREGTFTTGFFDLLIFADKVDTQSNQLSHVFIFDEREPKNPLTVVARAGEILPVKSGSALGTAAMLRLYDGSIHRNDAGGDVYQKIGFGEYNLFLKIDEGGSGISVKPGMIPYHELTDKIGHTDNATYEGREWRGEFWRRYATAFSPLVFVFLGIGFGTVRTRAVRAGAALTSLLILLLYWGLLTAGTLAVQKATLPAFFAMELANLSLGAVGFFAYRRSMW